MAIRDVGDGNNAEFGDLFNVRAFFPNSINPWTIRRSYDSKKCAEIKTYTGRNLMLMSTRKKMQKVLINNSGNGRSLDIDTGSMWENTEGVKEVMEAVLNLVVVEQARHSDVTCAP